MTDKLREAAQAALEELIASESNAWNVINDMEAALAEPEQEPVAWMSDCDVGFIKSEFGKYPCVPLYTAPPRREWVGLTIHDQNDCLVSADPCECLADSESHQLMDDVEARLKEKNT